MVQIERLGPEVDPIGKHHPFAPLPPKMVAGNEVKMSRSDGTMAAGRFHHGFAPNRKITFVTSGKVIAFVPGGRVTVQATRQKVQIKVFDHFAPKQQVSEC
jgi:hypothetical protein